MASIPNNIVAKDSGGNIKKIDLDQLLAGYVQTSSIQQLLQSNWPDCLVDGKISFTNPSIEGQEVNTPLNVETVKLSTALYGSSDTLYEASYNVDAPKIISETTDAYRFAISGSEASFGICSTRECFLVLSIDGLSSFASNTTCDINECRATGRHGGNPIILDWKKVALSEGGTFSFVCNDETAPFNIIGQLTLGRRLSYTGNVHRFNFQLNFIVCGRDAWTRLYDAYRLKLELNTSQEDVKETVVDLSPIAYPRISSIIVNDDNEVKLSNNAPTRLCFKGEDGVELSVATKDESNVSSDEKEITFGISVGNIVGRGLVVENGRISAPVFVPATSTSDATAGLVPYASAGDYNNILTASGWKSFAEIGFSSVLKPFVGATPHQDGDMGFVPAPTMANNGMYLKGDGTWSNAVSSISGRLSCIMSSVRKTISFGINLCNSSGEWMLQTMEFIVELTPESTEEGSFEVDIPIDDICGISLCSPWSSTVPATEMDNENSWIADKTIWLESKSGTFSAIFEDGTSADIWLASRVDEENPEHVWTVVHYRGRGSNVALQYPFLLLVDNVERPYTALLTQNESTSFTINATEIKIWPTSAKSRIRFEAPSASEESHGSNESQEQTAVPWGGYIWVNQERTAMLQGDSLTYLSETDNIVAPVSYSEHQSGDPVLLYGLDPQAGFWDIILSSDLEYSGSTIASGTVVGHVWEDGSTIRAVSQFFANWSIQPALHETTEAIGTTQSSAQEEVIQENQWITINEVRTFIPGIGLAVSRTESGIDVHVPAIGYDSWPKQADDISLVLDYGYEEEPISLSCLSEWINERFYRYDGEIRDLDSRIRSTTNGFTGATAQSNGSPGLVPQPSAGEQNFILYGDGSWREITLPGIYQGATELKNGVAGLVPAAAINERTKYLKGDGTWAELVLPNVYQGATAVENGVAGLVPAASAGEQGKILLGSGSWENLMVVTSTMPASTDEGQLFFYVEE